jgi:hypothetical protein
LTPTSQVFNAIERADDHNNYRFSGSVYNLSVKEPPPSDWLAFVSSNWIATAWKASDGAGVLIMLPNRARQSQKPKWEIVLV